LRDCIYTTPVLDRRENGLYERKLSFRRTEYRDMLEEKQNTLQQLLKRLQESSFSAP
jgi:hypothetical protein